jgi:beta-1,4-mannosyl-glycoprotein beta-1,4-N-acetylglucosaminyltransferase
MNNTTNIKIIDCFIFYNELDMLTYRLNVLNHVVDYFVIVESTHTFTGKEKRLFFSDNIDLFSQFKEKIIHIVVDDFPYKYPNINFNNNEQWLNEHFQRNSILRGLNNINHLNEKDVIIIADVDEIPDPNTLYNIKNGVISVSINTLEMDMYYYNLNTRFNTKWSLCKILEARVYNELGITCNDIRQLHCSRIIHGGWHLSYFGDSQFIKNKINTFSHQEYNTENYTDLIKIEQRIKNGSDLYDRSHETSDLKQIPINENTYLPVEYDVYLKKYFT